MPQPINSDAHLLALDIGDKRIGVAIASMKAMLANPLLTITNDQNFMSSLKKIVKDNNVQLVVIGLPRNLSGNDSNQTSKIRQTIDQLKDSLKLDIVTQDEALSSVRAEEELARHGKMFSKADIDKLAACLILEDYISSLRS